MADASISISGPSRLSVTLMTFVLVLLAGCSLGRDSLYLPALLADPMTQWMPPGLKGDPLTRTTPYSQGGTFKGKPQQAIVERTFTFLAADAAETALNDGVREAATNGWQPEIVDGLFRKPLADATAHLTLVQSSDHPNQLILMMTLIP